MSPILNVPVLILLYTVQTGLEGFDAEGNEMVLQGLIHLCFALGLWEPLVANLSCWITLHVLIKLVGLYCLSWTDSLYTVWVWPNFYWESYCLFRPPRNWGKATHSNRLSCVLVREGMHRIFSLHAIVVIIFVGSGETWLGELFVSLKSIPDKFKSFMKQLIIYQKGYIAECIFTNLKNIYKYYYYYIFALSRCLVQWFQTVALLSNTAVK